jgi:hypothetical protein
MSSVRSSSRPKGYATRRRVALLLFLAYSAAWGQSVECPPGCSLGRWSNEAVDLSSVRSKAPYETRDIRVVSPDRQKTARIVKDQWWIEIGGVKFSLGTKKSSILYPAEFAWAPNSRALYITEGAGYTTGYRVDIYRLENNKLRTEHDVNHTVQREFERRHKCAEGQLPNVAGVHWMDDSQHLLLVAEEPPLGICPDMDYFGGYLISVGDGRIVERYSPEAMEDRWKDVLGYSLKGEFDQLSAEQRAAMP